MQACQGRVDALCVGEQGVPPLGTVLEAVIVCLPKAELFLLRKPGAKGKSSPRGWESCLHTYSPDTC